MNEIPPGARSGLRVLVVEDDPLVSRLIVRVLQARAIDVVVVGDGLEALAYLRENPGLVSLILLDLGMPRMSGVEFLAVRKRDKALAAIPVIVVSAQAEFTKLSPYDVKAVIAKPFAIGDFVEAVRTHAAVGA